MMDYFNKDERAKQKKFAAKRDQIFNPVIKLLISTNITPNQVSIAGIIFLVIACLLPGSFHVLIAVCLILYVFCDGVDGPLARKTNTAHPGGSLVDIVADQLGVVFLPAAATFHLDVFGASMVIFASAYIAFIGLVVYSNAIEVDLPTFFRVKYFFFGLYWLSMMLQKDMVSLFATVFGIYYCVMFGMGLKRIYDYHNKVHEDSKNSEPV